KHSFYLPVSMESTAALSAFEIASWDILGKIYGMPVNKAFGGAIREKIRAYANGWYDACVTPEDFVSSAKKVVRMGFTGVKFDPFGDAYDNIDNDHVDHAAEIVGALREEFNKLDLMIECHGRFNANSAMRVARALKPFKPLFIEEPVHPDQFEGLLRFRKYSRMPVALGERVLDRNLFLSYMTNNAVDIIQPDITNFGGLMQGKGVADMANSFGIEVAYHNAFGPIQTAATLNLDYTIPNLLIQESFEAFWPEWKKKLVKSGYKLEDGYFILDTDKPGLGIEVNERILEEYKVSGSEPFNDSEPAWVVGGTFKPANRKTKKVGR
ncbi:MAG: mandelate racemase/muconate lactonizing enzyme family protein, partial [Methanothrix sp.]